MYRYGICNETYQGWTWPDTCRSIAASGYEYVEVAPFTLADDIRSLNAATRAELGKVAEDCGLRIIGLHWLLVSPKGLSITSPDKTIREQTADYIAALVDFCADLGGSTMVLGSPAQRRLPAGEVCGQQSPQTVAREMLFEALAPAILACSNRNVTICLEPLPAPEADFVLNLAEAVELVRAFDHPNTRTMLDIKSASSDLAPIPELISRYSHSIKHVHANDANRRGPGFGDTDFVPVMQALIEAGYNGPISVEVFDYTPDAETIANNSLSYLKRCETTARRELGLL